MTTGGEWATSLGKGRPDTRDVVYSGVTQGSRDGRQLRGRQRTARPGGARQERISRTTLGDRSDLREPILCKHLACRLTCLLRTSCLCCVRLASLSHVVTCGGPAVL